MFGLKGFRRDAINRVSTFQSIDIPRFVLFPPSRGKLKGGVIFACIIVNIRKLWFSENKNTPPTPLFRGEEDKPLIYLEFTETFHASSWHFKSSKFTRFSQKRKITQELCLGNRHKHEVVKYTQIFFLPT